MRQGYPRYKQKVSESFPFLDRNIPFAHLPEETRNFRLEVVKRLDEKLGTAFEEMEQTIGRIFDREIIKRLLFLYYEEGSGEYILAEARKKFDEKKRFARIEANLQKISQAYRNLLEELEGDSPYLRVPTPRGERSYKEIVELALYETNEALYPLLADFPYKKKLVSISPRQAKYEKQILSKKNCLATSNAITCIVDYCWTPLSNDYDQAAAALYKGVGALITAFSTPSCFVCSKRHIFNGWRAVRARDQHKGQWRTRAARIKQLREQRAHQYIKDMKDWGFSSEIIQDQKDSLKKIDRTEIFSSLMLGLLQQLHDIRMQPARAAAAKTLSR